MKPENALGTVKGSPCPTKSALDFGSNIEIKELLELTLNKATVLEAQVREQTWLGNTLA